MPISQVEIANGALTRLGAQAILSLNDDSTEARTMLLRYDPVRRIVLRKHPWNCAIKRVQLAPENATPAYEFTNQFILPSDNLRLLEVADDIYYRIEGRKILANATVLNIKYLYDLTDVPQMDELLAAAISAYLAWDTCKRITGSTELRPELWEDFKDALRSAKTVDAQEERDYEVEADEFINSRISSPDNGRSNR